MSHGRSGVTERRDLSETGCEEVHSSEAAQERVEWQTIFIKHN